jgi:hypothetical protein
VESGSVRVRKILVHFQIFREILKIRNQNRKLKKTVSFS